MPDRVAIVGSGGAGTTVALELRALGYDGHVVLYGAEGELPYDRTTLSKELLTRSIDDVDALMAPPERYGSDSIELRLGSPIAAIDLREKTLTSAAGISDSYDVLVLATGATPRELDVPGSTLDGVYLLRTIEDCRRLREASHEHVIMAGLGLIGCEVAAVLREQGVTVTAINADPWPLSRALGTDVAKAVAQLHAASGVDLVHEQTITRIEGRMVVEGVTTGDGSTIEADAVVVGVGVTPNIELAVSMGLDCADGVPVDGHCRTSIPSVYAVGDVASQFSPLRSSHVRTEHWDSALSHGRAAAMSIVGLDPGEPDLPRYSTMQYGLSVHVAGFTDVADDVILHGSLTAKDLSAIYLSSGTVVGALSTNRPRDVRRSVELIRGRARPAAHQLTGGLRHLVNGQR